MIYVYVKYSCNICLQDSTLQKQRLTFKNYVGSFLIRGCQVTSFFKLVPIWLILWQLSLPGHTSLTLTRSVTYLRCSSREIGVTCTLAPMVIPLALFPKEIGNDIAETTTDRNARITVKLPPPHPGTDRLRLSSTFCLFLNIRTLKNHVEMKRSRATLSTMETTLSMRLPILPDGCSPHPWPEVSLESLKRSGRLPGLWAAVLMAATHMTSLMTSTVGQQNTQLLKTTKENILIRDHWTTKGKKCFMEVTSSLHETKISWQRIFSDLCSMQSHMQTTSPTKSDIVKKATAFNRFEHLKIICSITCAYA